MPIKIPLQLQNVQKTLLLPLWGRAVETQKKKPALLDTTAAEIIKKIDYDFSTIAINTSTISQLGWIARSLHIDRTINRFIHEYPRATIVNIGCGLDTTFERIDNGKIYWYDLDLPPVISLRREFIHENERRKFLACSFLDGTWLRQLNIVDNIMFIAAGVFYYFEENEIKIFFINLADLFPESEIVFDACSPLGVKVANKKVIQNSGMDEKAVLTWGFESARKIRQWDSRIILVDEYRIFRNVRKNLNFKNKIGTLISDSLNIMFMVHLRFKK